MREFSVEAVAAIIKAEPTGPLDGAFTRVSTDSRDIKGGECFFAISGPNFDGHDYVGQAFAKGAVCAVVGRDIDSVGGIVLKVPDTVKALGSLAAEYRRRMNFKVVAITGSAGKTTTRHIAAHVLSSRFRVRQSPKSFNNDIGVPLTLLGAEPDDEIVVAEIGTNHPGEIAPLTKIAAPDIAVVTNVYPVHLEGLGDLAGVIREKLSIADGLRPDGILLINRDFEQLVAACREKGVKFSAFGSADSSGICVRDVLCGQTGSSFTIDGVKIHLPLPGPGNVENALAAWAICSRFGLAAEQFAEALKTLPAVPMRAQLDNIGTLTVLNDCYNANPASMKNALDILANLGLARKRRLVFVCGDMAELAQQSRQLHAELGRMIARTGVEVLLAVGEFAQATAEAAKQSADRNMLTKCFEDADSACNNLKEFVKDYDIILVKGSRKARLETVVEKLRELFAEA